MTGAGRCGHAFPGRVTAALCASAIALGAWSPASAQSARLTLATLAMVGFVDVTLDTSRFGQEQVATIKVANKMGFPIEGEIPACFTVFEPADTRLAALVPAESGGFTVGAAKTIQVTRPFRLLDPSKRPPDGSAYRLSQPLRHDLSRCPEED
jgi:hypothetical protein